MSRAERKWICGGHGQRVWVEAPCEAGRGHKGVLVALGALTLSLSFCKAISMPQQSERERLLVKIVAKHKTKPLLPAQKPQPKIAYYLPSGNMWAC